MSRSEEQSIIEDTKIIKHDIIVFGDRKIFKKIEKIKNWSLRLYFRGIYYLAKKEIAKDFRELERRRPTKNYDYDEEFPEEDLDGDEWKN